MSVPKDKVSDYILAHVYYAIYDNVDGVTMNQIIASTKHARSTCSAAARELAKMGCITYDPNKGTPTYTITEHNCEYCTQETTRIE